MNRAPPPLHCYLCGSSDCRRVHDHIRYGLPPRPYRCQQCGLVFLHPQMDPEEERRFYEKEYRSGYVDEPPEKTFSYSLSESQERVDRFRTLFSPEHDLLEIGCAAGSFLSLVRPYVRSVRGIEVTPTYATFAKEQGIPVAGSLEALPDRAFDLVFSFHVLEHLHDPIRHLTLLRSKLRRGGQVIIEVPNVDDILVSVYRIPEHLDFYWEIAHQFYFSKATLAMVLEKAGYHHEIFPLQRYDLSNHIYWMLYRKPGGKGHFRHLFSRELDQEYEKILKERFITDTLYVRASPME